MPRRSAVVLAFLGQRVHQAGGEVGMPSRGEGHQGNVLVVKRVPGELAERPKVLFDVDGAQDMTLEVVEEG